MFKRKLLVLLAVSSFSFLSLSASSQDLPDFGDSSRKVLSKSEEKKLGKQIMQNLRYQMPFVNDPFIQEYIQSLGDRLVSHSSLSGELFTFFMVDASTINAFALPGNNIGIHSGLLLTTKTQSELAGVIAHEIAHVSQQHISRMFEHSKKMTLPTIAAIIGSLALASASPEAGGGALMATMAATQQSMINFTRGNEEEADRIGIELLHHANFNPYGMPDFFERMQQANRYNEFDFPEFLRTHPVTQSRISDTRNRAQRLGKAKPTSQTHYRLIRTRTESLTQNNHQELALKYKELIKHQQFSDNQVNHYGYALALFNSGKFHEAEIEAKSLVKKNKYELLYYALLADALGQQKKEADALKILSELLILFPGNHPLTLQYAKLLYANGENKKAYRIFKEHVRYYPNDLQSYQLLSELAASNQYIWQAHDAQAHYFELLGDFTNAIRQLEAAKKLKKEDAYVVAMLDARIKQLKQDEKEYE